MKMKRGGVIRKVTSARRESQRGEALIALFRQPDEINVHFRSILVHKINDWWHYKCLPEVSSARFFSLPLSLSSILSLCHCRIELCTANTASTGRWTSMTFVTGFRTLARNCWHFSNKFADAGSSGSSSSRTSSIPAQFQLLVSAFGLFARDARSNCLWEECE